MQLYEWNSAAELAFRKTVASSANVWVNHVRVDSVTARQVNRRRNIVRTFVPSYVEDTFKKGRKIIKCREGMVS